MFTTISMVLYHLGLFSILFVQEAKASDFDDLGVLLLGGVVVAIAVGLAVTVIRMRLHNKKASPPSFISINSFREEEDRRQ